MKFYTLEKFFKHMCFEVFCEDSSFVEDDYVTITRIPDSIDVSIQKKDFPEKKILTQFVTPENAKKWDKVKNAPYLAHIDRKYQGRIVISVVYDLSPIVMESSSISIAVLDKALINNKDKRRNFSVEDITEECVLFAGQAQYILIAISIFKGNEEEHNKELEEFQLIRDDFKGNEEDHNKELEEFQLIRGDGNVYSVSMKFRSEIVKINTEEEQDGKVYCISNSYRPFSKEEDYVIHLCQANLDLCDKSSATMLRNSDRTLISNNLEEYVTGWRDYAELEMEIATRIHDEANTLVYDMVASADTDQEGTHRLVVKGNIDRFWSA